MSWWEYVVKVAGDNQAEIAYKSGLSQPSIWRWQKNVPKPQNVATFARAYNRPVIEAFVAAGYLDEDEAEHTLVIDRKAADLSDAELLAEVESRVRHARELQDAVSRVNALPALTHKSLDQITTGTGVTAADLAEMHARLDEDQAAAMAEREDMSMDDARRAISKAMREAGAPEVGADAVSRSRRRDRASE